VLEAGQLPAPKTYYSIVKDPLAAALWQRP